MEEKKIPIVVFLAEWFESIFDDREDWGMAISELLECPDCPLYKREVCDGHHNLYECGRRIEKNIEKE